MLMMFGSALRKAPYERAMPFNNEDIMILINPKYAIRLCNITTEAGLQFDIRAFMTSEKDVFGKQDFSERVKEFAEILSSRIERFFITKKSEYIFFDEEEQKFIRKIMSKSGVSCSVELYEFDKYGEKQRIDILDIEDKYIKDVMTFLSACKIREVMHVRDYYISAKAKRAGRKHSGFNRNKMDSPMKKYFKRYSKLSSLKTKKDVNLYFKKLKVKYHPDRGGDTNIAATITGDFEEIKKLRWYVGLRDE